MLLVLIFVLEDIKEEFGRTSSRWKVIKYLFGIVGPSGWIGNDYGQIAEADPVLPCACEDRLGWYHDCIQTTGVLNARRSVRFTDRRRLRRLTSFTEPLHGIPKELGRPRCVRLRISKKHAVEPVNSQCSFELRMPS